MASITSWTRIEPQPRDTQNIETSLEARVQDPLWLMSRQWQLGEFQGEDAGSPIAVRTELDQSRLGQYLRRTLEPGQRFFGESYDPAALPLEALVERQPVRIADNKNARHAVEAGLQYLRFLEAEGLGSYRGRIISSYPVIAAARDQDVKGQRFMRAIGGRAPDGIRIHADLRRLNPALVTLTGTATPLVLPLQIGFTDEDAPRARIATLAYLDWYQGQLFSEPAAGTSSLVPERMEYRFSLGAPLNVTGTTVSEAILVSRAYRGDLDWYSFNLLGPAPNTSIGTRGAATALPAMEAIPVPVRYPGMPATRFWEFEDTAVNLGRISVEPSDLARLLLTEFAVAYSNDWFLVPIELDVGALYRTRRLRVVDTFGVSTDILPFKRQEVAGQRFCLYELTPETPGDTSLLFLAPVIRGAHASPILEEVHFRRDEAANHVWAVEARVQGAGGHPLDRGRLPDASPPDEAPSAGESDFPLSYSVMSSVPAHLFPMLRRAGDPGPPRLRIGEVAGGTALPAPWGQLLHRNFTLLEQEVPREGLRITRAFQYARWMQGTTHVWASYTRGPAEGDIATGLRFDSIEYG